MMAPNFRELAGFSDTAGRTLKPGLIYRSGVIDGRDPAAMQRFTELGVQLCCDLRSAGERDRQPNPCPRVLALEVAADIRTLSPEAFSRLRTERSADAAMDLMRFVYRQFPQSCAPVLRRLFEELVGVDTLPILVHCTAGKDRTGFVIAMLLAALDVDRAQYLGDYLRSTDFAERPELAGRISVLVDELTGMASTPEMVRALAGVDPSYLQAAIEQIERSHGSIDAYLVSAAGLDARLRARLRERLLA